MLAWLRRLLASSAPAERGVIEPAPTEPELEAHAPAPVPLDGQLDLHAFRPEEVADLVTEYVRACRAEGVLALRIVHGKGRGVLRRTVHHALARMPDDVAGFRLAGEGRGGWGATLVTLRPP